MRFSFAAGLALAAVCGSVRADPVSTNGFSDVLGDLDRRFHATQPGVVLDYEGTYQFLCMELKKLASLQITATEGAWQTGDAAPVPACKLVFHLFNPREKQEGADAPLKLNKRNICVLSLPDLNMLRYVKLNDEVIRPLFGRSRRLRYVETYDFRPDQVLYLKHDLESGEVVTNLPNIESVARQSFEVGKVIRNLHRAYLAESATNAPVEMHFTVNGQVRTFGLFASKTSLDNAFLQRKATVLRGDIRRTDPEGASMKGFSVSCLPFREVAAVRQDPYLDALAAQAQEWYMIPVAGRYELLLGGIECTLQAIRGEEKTDRPLCRMETPHGSLN